MGLEIANKGAPTSRVRAEALKGSETTAGRPGVMKSEPGPAGLVAALNFQTVETVINLNAAGFPGRTVGLDFCRRSNCAEESRRRPNEVSNFIASAPIKCSNSNSINITFEISELVFLSSNLCGNKYICLQKEIYSGIERATLNARRTHPLQRRLS
jgi:hypothetical protein